MTEPNVTPNISDCQFQKSFIQAGLFPEDGDVIPLTEKENKSANAKAYYRANKTEIDARHKAYNIANKNKIAEHAKIYHEKNISKKHEQSKTYYEKNVTKISERHKNYREKNVAKIAKQTKEYYEKNTTKLSEKKKTYYKANKDRIDTRNKKYGDANKDKASMRAKKPYYLKALYNTYQHKIQKYENIKQDENGVLLVICAYCGKYFTPTKRQVNQRIAAINGTTEGESRLYCSQLCKTACPTYNQQKYYKFQHIGYTREVPAVFRHMALLDRNYTCENCGSTKNGHHCHHINGYTESPMEMADLPNVKVLCASCHKAVHSVPGCFYVDYSCRNQKQ